MKKTFQANIDFVYLHQKLKVEHTIIYKQAVTCKKNKIFM